MFARNYRRRQSSYNDEPAAPHRRDASTTTPSMRHNTHMPYTDITYETDARLAFITLNRPEKLNALSNNLRGE